MSPARLSLDVRLLLLVLLLDLSASWLAVAGDMHDVRIAGLDLVAAGIALALVVRLERARRRASRTAARLAPDLERLAEVVRQTTNGVVITGLDGRITWVNDGFERLTGYSAAEILGRTPGSFLQCAATDWLTVARIREALAVPKGITCEVLNRSKQGREYWVELKIQTTFDAQGQPNGFMALQLDVTERKRSDAALRAGQALLDRTGRIGGVGGWEVDLRCGRVRFTDQTCRILDREPGFEPSVEDCLSHCLPDGRARIEAAIAQGLQNLSSWDMELPMVTASGREIWVHVAAECEYADQGAVRLVGALQDITVRRSLKAEIRRSAELLRGAINAIDEAFVLYDPDDRLVLCNDKYLDTYDTSRDLLVPGARFEDILREGARRGQYEAAKGREEEWVQRRLAAHRAGNRTLVQRLDNGRIVRVVERRMPDGHLVGFRVDITDLVRATEAAERADQAKGEFIATISHELRTPLQAILGFSDLGRHFAQGHPHFEPMFQDIHAGGTRMLRLVNGLLDVSKIDGTEGSLPLRPALLGPLVAEVARELSQLAGERGLHIRLPSPLPDVPATVDAFRIQQVVRNLLANAIRFAPQDSDIEIGLLHRPGDGITLSVRDHGPGIPAEELQSVFDAFVQSSRTRNGAGGTGLGLTICRKIVHAHGGHIEAQQPPDGGALLRVWLPESAPAAQAAGSLPADHAPTHWPSTDAGTHAGRAARLETSTPV